MYIVKCILSLPLSFRKPEDRLIWHYDKKGIFSVKKCLSCFSSAASNTYGEVWKKIWSARVPPKVKVRVWKIILDSIPSREKLRRKGIAASSGFQGESTVHIMSACPVGHPPSSSSLQSMLEWVSGWTTQLNPSQFAICLSILWAIWGVRNSRQEAEQKIEPTLIRANTMAIKILNRIQVTIIEQITYIKPGNVVIMINRNLNLKYYVKSTSNRRLSF